MDKNRGDEMDAERHASKLLSKQSLEVIGISELIAFLLILIAVNPISTTKFIVLMVIHTFIQLILFVMIYRDDKK